MNYKPDESILISYLYGELDEKENEKLLDYFKQHPEELKRVQEMANVMHVFGVVKDKEVIAPPIFTDHRPAGIRFWSSSYFKTVMSMAASLLLLMVAARLLNTEINYGQGELRISFGVKKIEQSVQPANQAALSAQAVQEMINTSLLRNNESVTRDWTDSQKKLDQSIRRSLDQNSKKVDDLFRNTSTASQDQLRSFVASLQDQNLRLMNDYFKLSATEQKRYVESLLGDFSKFLQDQRTQDLTLVQARVNSIEKNSDQFKQETEQILASIISNSTVKKNSY